MKAPEAFLQIARTVPNKDLFLRVGKLRPKGKKIWVKIKQHNGEVELKSWFYLKTQDLCRNTRAMLMKITFQVCGVVNKHQ